VTAKADGAIGSFQAGKPIQDGVPVGRDAIQRPVAAAPVAAVHGGEAPAQALELQHRTPLLIERINLFFGRPVVTRIALVQGPLPLPPAPPKPVFEPPSPQETAGLERQVAAVADTELRAALIGLGRAMIGAAPRRR